MTIALVVDDQPLITLEAVSMLEAAGFEAFDAYSADEALSVLGDHGHEITLLFTDVEMPGSMDGFALAREVAARWPKIGILVASGARSPEKGDMPAGASFVGKPFSADIVHARLCELLPPDRRPEPLRDR